MKKVKRDSVLEESIRVLGAVRRAHVCCYAQNSEESLCDCKYGATELVGRSFGGERTGCCEMRDAIDILSALTPAEYARVRTRISRARFRLSVRASKVVLKKLKAAAR